MPFGGSETEDRRCVILSLSLSLECRFRELEWAHREKQSTDTILQNHHFFFVGQSERVRDTDGAGVEGVRGMLA